MTRTIAIALTMLLAPATAPTAIAGPTAAMPDGAARTDPVATQLDHISVATMGKGDPVVLIPGLSSPRAVWDVVAPGIAKGHKLYLVQVNGFAGGDPRGNLDPGILDGIVADLHEYIARNKIEGAAVVGHSMGGLVALMLAKAYPDDAGKLMIVDSLPYVGDIFMPGATVAQVEPQARAMRDQQKASYGKPADAANVKATAMGLALKPSSQSTVAQWFEAADPRVSAQAMYEDMTTDLRPDMASIDTPITLVYPLVRPDAEGARRRILPRRIFKGARGDLRRHRRCRAFCDARSAGGVHCGGRCISGRLSKGGPFAPT
ncbi:alpha/beta hydrolase [Stakelama marina]|uniref:alpha/beta hydrolase n=1 Tax=Stakelama marina TaxID=2826939 RepID=UPI0024C3EBE7|nr:alpha/beta hydrolase [Stakelama marina]